jgi:hypothetical protein
MLFATVEQLGKDSALKLNWQNVSNLLHIKVEIFKILTS